MTLLPLTDCCLFLGVDPKTLRHWLQSAHLSWTLHPGDALSAPGTQNALRSEVVRSPGVQTRGCGGKVAEMGHLAFPPSELEYK